MGSPAFFSICGLVAGYYYVAAAVRAYLSGRWAKVEKPILVVIPIGLVCYFFFVAFQVSAFQSAKDVPWLGALLSAILLGSPIYTGLCFIHYARKKRHGRLKLYENVAEFSKKL